MEFINLDEPLVMQAELAPIDAIDEDYVLPADDEDWLEWWFSRTYSRDDWWGWALFLNRQETFPDAA